MNELGPLNGGWIYNDRVGRDVADLVVLDNDPFAVDPMAIRDIGVRATVVDGITEYEA